MRPFFQPRLLGGPFEDPCVRVDLVGFSKSLLFDLGWVAPPARGRVAPISHVFISHTHVDHFIGFDPLIRSLLPKPKVLKVYGPPGIIGNVAGKLGGYTWNLVEQYPLAVEVYEVAQARIRCMRFRCDEGLRGTEGGEAPFSGQVCREGPFIVEAAHLDHHVPSMAYLLREPFHVSVNKERLKAGGLEAGPWLRTVRRLLYEGAPGHSVIDVPREHRPRGRAGRVTLEELRDSVLILTRGQRIAYVADCIYSEDNREKIRRIAAGADLMFCEAFFSQADAQRALESGHLTAPQAGMLAREAGVKKLKVFHFSKRYEGRNVDLEREALEAFRG